MRSEPRGLSWPLRAYDKADSVQLPVQLLFVLAAISAAAFFLYRWRLDTLAVGAGATLFYFSPGLLGDPAIPRSTAEPIVSEMVPGTYAVMVIVMLGLIAGTLASDRFMRPAHLSVNGNGNGNGRLAWLPHALFAITVAGLAVSIYTTGASYFCEKQFMLSRLDGFYFVALYGGVLCMGASLASGRWPFVILLCGFVAGALFIGFRDSAAMSLLTAVMLFGDKALRNRRIFLKFGAGALACVAVLVLYKEAAWSIKHITSAYCPITITHSVDVPGVDVDTTGPLAHGRGDRPALRAPDKTAYKEPLLDRIARIAKSAILVSEATVITVGLNEVVKADFTTSLADLGKQAASILPFVGPQFPSLVWKDIPTFNSQFQPALFPDVPYGMAGSVWAQAYSAGGYWLVGIFALGYVAILALLGWLMASTTGPMRGAAAVLAAWWGFYIHRNDLMIEFSIMKMSLIILLAATLISVFAARYLSGRRLLLPQS